MQENKWKETFISLQGLQGLRLEKEGFPGNANPAFSLQSVTRAGPHCVVALLQGNVAPYHLMWHLITVTFQLPADSQGRAVTPGGQHWTALSKPLKPPKKPSLR